MQNCPEWTIINFLVALNKCLKYKQREQITESLIDWQTVFRLHNILQCRYILSQSWLLKEVSWLLKLDRIDHEVSKILDSHKPLIQVITSEDSRPSYYYFYCSELFLLVAEVMCPNIVTSHNICDIFWVVTSQNLQSHKYK